MHYFLTCIKCISEFVILFQPFISTAIFVKRSVNSSEIIGAPEILGPSEIIAKATEDVEIICQSNRPIEWAIIGNHDTKVSFHWYMNTYA